MDSYPSLFVILIILISCPKQTTPLNLTSLLSQFPNLTTFTKIFTPSFPTLTSTLQNRTSLTLLTVPNSHFTQNSPSLSLTHRLSPSSLTDLLRYHIILQFLSPSDLSHLPTTGTLFPTLLQTTGRYAGLVNLTDKAVASPSSSGGVKAGFLGVVKCYAYNVSIFAIDELVLPDSLDLMSSEHRSLGFNITSAILDGHNFNVVASMLAASGVVDEFEKDEAGAGITLFVPTDSAFGEVEVELEVLGGGGGDFRSLSADKKAVVLKFHVLHSYYPLGSLESIVNPVQPTLATEDMGAGKFTLNISRVNGSVAIDSGIVQASVTQTVFDQNPVAIFGISKVLLPKEYFGAGGVETGVASPPDDFAEAPEDLSPSHWVSPPAVVASGVDGRIAGVLWLRAATLCCMALYYVV